MKYIFVTACLTKVEVRLEPDAIAAAALPPGCHVTPFQTQIIGAVRPLSSWGNSGCPAIHGE